MDNQFQDELVELLPRLRRFALSLTGKLDDADDLVQQSCEKALQRHHQWQRGTRLDSWMYKIIKNQHIDNLRRNQSRPEISEKIAIDDAPGLQSENKAETNDMITKVSSIIDELPEEQRTVMLLVAVEGNSYKEVAELLDLPVGTVMSRLFRARNRILTLINDESALTLSAV